MLVTLFSDAGLCTLAPAASWGAWVKSERGTRRFGGIFRDAPDHTGVLEARAACNAIRSGLNGHIIQPGDHIIIQTDNQQVRAILAGEPPKSGRHLDLITATAAQYGLLCRDHRLTAEWRHIKGHSGMRNRRSSVNNFCDGIATFYLGLERHRRAPTRFPRPGAAPWGIRDPRLEL